MLAASLRPWAQDPICPLPANPMLPSLVMQCIPVYAQHPCGFADVAAAVVEDAGDVKLLNARKRGVH